MLSIDINLSGISLKQHGDSRASENQLGISKNVKSPKGKRRENTLDSHSRLILPGRKMPQSSSLDENIMQTTCRGASRLDSRR